MIDRFEERSRSQQSEIEWEDLQEKIAAAEWSGTKKDRDELQPELLEHMFEGLMDECVLQNDPDVHRVAGDLFRRFAMDLGRPFTEKEKYVIDSFLSALEGLDLSFDGRFPDWRDGMIGYRSR